MSARSVAVRSQSETDRSDLEWRRQFLLFRRRCGLFTVVWGMGIALSGAAILALPLRYAATADLLIDPHRDPAADLRALPQGLGPESAAVDTEVEVLKSRALAEKTVDRLKLDRDSEFASLRRSPSWFGWTSFTAPPTARPSNEAAVERLMKRLRISRVGLTYVVSITARSASADKAALIVNTLADAYLQQQLNAKLLAAQRVSDLLNGRLDSLRKELEAADDKVERYKAANGLMTLTDSQGATIGEQEISSLDAQLAAARGQRAEADARLAAARAQTAGGGRGDDVGEVLESPVVQELRKQKDDLAKQIVGLQARYGPRYPELIKAERQRNELEAQLQEETARVISNLSVQTRVARSRSDGVEAALGTAKATLAKTNAASVVLNELERNRDSVRALYQSFLDRFKQMGAQAGMALPDARLISPAKAPPNPAFPDRLLLFGLGVGMSMLLALGSIWVAEMREDGLYAAEDVQRRLGLPCLGVVPLAQRAHGGEGAPASLVLSQPFSGFAEAFRALRAALLASTPQPLRTIAIASAVPGEGKTTTCVCLGRSLARTGASVVVVDCDLRRRALSRFLLASPKAGLLDVLTGAATLEEALVADGDSGLYFLPLGDEMQAEDDSLASAAMDRLLEQLRRRFKLMLLDTAPVLMVAETRLLAGKTDTTLFLTRWGKTSVAAASAAIRLLEDAGARVAGTALTQVNLRHLDSAEYAYAADYYPFERNTVLANVRRPLVALSDRVK